MPRKTFVAGEVLAAADVNTYLMDQAVMTFAGSAARGSAIASPSEGMVSYLEDTDSVEVFDSTNWIQVGGTQPGMVLQVVTSSDATDRTTTSTSLVDVTGMTISITPQRSDSKLIIICAALLGSNGGTNEITKIDVTDSSNVSILGSGANNYVGQVGADNSYHYVTLMGEVSPGSTATVTYKMRFAAIYAGQTVTVQNGNGFTGRMFAIEVAQ